MPLKPPTEFRIGDRLRLRKVHPCGGRSWTVVRLGADIGLVCETCGRRVLLERSVLERRVKKVLAHGTESVDLTASPSALSDAQADFPCDLLGLRANDVLEASTDLEVTVSFFYRTSSDIGTAKLNAGQRVRVPSVPPPGETRAMLEPTEYADFERRFVPGGVRQQESYTGYAITVRCADLARFFRQVDAR